MTTASQESPQVYARLAGLFYLALIPLGAVGILLTSSLIEAGDAAATAQNITDSETLFRVSIVCALLVQVFNIMVVLSLYRLLSPVSKNAAALMGIFILIGAPIAMLNELNRLAALFLVVDADYLAGLFSSDQLQAAALFCLNLHDLGVHIAGIFWGLWLFPMGYLVYKSGFFAQAYRCPIDDWLFWVSHRQFYGLSFARWFGWHRWSDFLGRNRAAPVAFNQRDRCGTVETACPCSGLSKANWDKKICRVSSAIFPTTQGLFCGVGGCF